MSEEEKKVDVNKNRVTIVGGRTIHEYSEAENVPRNWELLLKKAVLDQTFREALIRDRSRFTDSLQWPLEESERRMLDLIPESQLRTIISKTRVNKTETNALATLGMDTLKTGCILGLISAVLAAITVPNFKRAGGQAREKSCYANMRVILGAVEMYNMDNDNMIRELTDETLQRIETQGYLKACPKCPGTGDGSSAYDLSGGQSYRSIGDLTKKGKIICPIHGSVE